MWRENTCCMLNQYFYYIDKTKIEGLNIKSGFPVENCLNDRTLNIFTKSDCDQ